MVVCAQFVRAVPSYAASFPEPIARAGMGQLQCYAPNAAKKTCGGLVSFQFTPNGKIVATAVVLVSPSPTILMKGVASVVARSGELCGRLSERDFEQASFSDGEADLEPMQSRFLRTLLATSLQSYFGREICGTFIAKGAAFLVRATMDGAAIQTDPQRVIWVRPEENYKVAP